jgi:hypothetical protein
MTKQTTMDCSDPAPSGDGAPETNQGLARQGAAAFLCDISPTTPLPQSHLRWWPLEASKGFHFAMAKKPSQEIEFHPDGMQRFERAVKVVAKSPPQRRVAKKAAKKTKAKKKPGNDPGFLFRPI